jgi:hypothetical protein
VEHLVGYAKRDLIVPQAPAIDDLTAANAAAAVWCVEMNTTVHSEICAVPADRPETERALLTALPSLRPQLGERPISRKVDKLSCVRFGSARYSVPVRLIGTTVLLTVTDCRVLVAEPSTGHIVADHALVAPGETSIHDAHYGSTRPDKPRRAPRAKTATEKQFLALGEVAEAFLLGAAAAGVAKLPGKLAEILTLQATHGEPALLAALGRAVAFRRWRADDVRSILAAGGAAPDPRPAGQALVLTLPTVPTRPLSTTRLTSPAAVGPREHRPTASGAGPDRRAAPAQAGRDASARPGAAGHRQDPTLGTRRAAAHPGRSRDHRPRRVQRPQPDARRGVTGGQNPGRVRRGQVVEGRSGDGGATTSPVPAPVGRAARRQTDDDWTKVVLHL